MKTGEHFLTKKINERLENGLFRRLNHPDNLIDFCSNDYLGFANSLDITNLINQTSIQLAGFKNGSTGSRLISGNDPYTEQTEEFIAKYHSAETGLLFNSGYDANVGLLSSIPQRGDTIITDELIHASLIDGARLSYAERYKFKHNDLLDLEQKLKNAEGNIFVVAESVYSMDGDRAPLVEISKLCKTYDANLIVDEAHAVGIFGYCGKGLVNELGLENDIFARIVTFGKALGAHGAIVLGSKNLRNYLINFARSFIYTTAPSLHQIVTINCAYQQLAKGDQTLLLKEKIDLYNYLIADLDLSNIKSSSSIQTIVLGAKAKDIEKRLITAGFNVKAILSPTVPQGKERLRICLHTYNSNTEIQNLVKEFKHIFYG